MRRRRKKAPIRVGREDAGDSEDSKSETRNTKPGTGNHGNCVPKSSSRFASEGRKPEASRMSQYVFTFEFVRQYPTVRSFIVKGPLKRSFKDSIEELIGGSKKGTYRF